MNLTLKEFLNTLENGAQHLLIFDEYGEIIFCSIWFNLIPEQYLNRKIDYTEKKSYEIRIFLL